MMTALPPLMAYRADTAAAPDAQLLDDAQWLSVAAQLARAARLPAEQQPEALSVFIRDFGPTAAIAPDMAAIRSAACQAGIRAATAMEDAARFHLAFTTLSNVLILLPDEETRVRGRVLAQQGRIARQIGEVADSLARYEAVEALAAEHDDNELFARAWIGYGVHAYLRGNHPDVRSWCNKVLDLQDVAEPLRQLAHRSLIVAAATARDFDGAAVHAWAAFQNADEESEAEALIYVAEVFLQAGYPRLALKGFGAALLRPLVPRYELPALGGAAVAAARALPAKRARPLVERFATRIQTIITTTQIPYANASALADIGDAYAALGALEAASTMRAQARTVAERHRFNELVHRLEAAERVTALRSVADLRAAAPVAEAVDSFETPADVTRALAEV